MSEIVSFGVWMQKRRKLLDLTRKALADLVGCSPTTINKIERDERKPSVEIAELLAVHLQIPDSEREAFVQRARGTYLVDFDAPTAMGVAPQPVGETVAETKASIAHNLPTQPTPFLGRAPEIKTLTDYLADPDKRLLTILGAGGMGKTRLALAVAEQQITNNQFTNGVFFVSLAPLSEPDQMIPTLADALNFPLETGGEQQRTAKQQVLDYLRQKSMLLIFDNFEHLLAGVDLVAEILQTAVSIKIIATSRERLQLRQEQLFTIHGLDMPATVNEEMGTFTAVQLFLQSARRVRHDFEPSVADQPALVRLCHLVGGMPLAVELAAGWVEMLSLAEIVAELQQGLDLLETAVRNIPARQRSIRAVFDGSWKQLSQAEQQILPHFAIFRGGFTRQAAQTITGASLHSLSKLVNKSLLQYDAPRQRYQIHELLRQYLAEWLDQDEAQEKIVRAAHSRYYLNALAERETKLKGREQQTALAEIEADIENVRVAWQWGVAQGDVNGLAEAMDALGLFLEWNGRFQDGATTFQPLLDAPFMVANPLILARALGWTSVFQRVVVNPETAVSLLERGLAIVDGLPTGVDSQAVKGFLLLQNGRFALASNYAEAQASFTTCLTLFRDLSDQWNTAYTLQNLGEAAWGLGNYLAATSYLDESITIYRLLGTIRGLVTATLTASTTARYNGNHDKAYHFAKECLAMSEQLGDIAQLALALRNMANCYAFGSGCFIEALKLQTQSTDIIVNLANPLYQSQAFFGLGAMLGLAGQSEAAISVLWQGIAIAKENQQKYWLAMCLHFLGQLLPISGKLDKGYELELQAYKIFADLAAPDGKQIALAHLLLLDLYAKDGFFHEEKILNILQDSYKRKSFFVLWGALRLILALLTQQALKATEKHSLSLVLALEIITMWEMRHKEFDFATQEYIIKELKPLFQQLPQSIVTTAQKKGQHMDWWEMAAYLLEELPKLGWGVVNEELSGVV